MAMDPGKLKLIERSLKKAVQRAMVENLPEYWLRAKRKRFRAILDAEVDGVVGMFRLVRPAIRFRRYHTGSVWFEMKAVGFEIDIHVHGKGK